MRNRERTDVPGCTAEKLIMGESPQIKKIQEVLERIAPFNTSILLTGESGVGKSCFAELIHRLSSRNGKNMVTINCGAIPENLLESELFGYDEGAFTGASSKGKAGLIEIAHESTLFLDEIGDLPLHMQVKLLKVLQEKKLTRVGSAREKSIDFRLIAATSKDLKAAVEAGAFRKDLFYRLNVISIEIPPLRKRKEDIRRFVESFADDYCRLYGKQHTFSENAMDAMVRYLWPGNVRELENVVEGVILTAEESIITKDMLPPVICHKDVFERYKSEDRTLKEILQQVEKQVILEAYAIHGTTTKTAEALGVSQASISLKLKKYNANSKIK